MDAHGNVRAMEHGECPHCKRRDAIKLMAPCKIQPNTPRFNCGGCGSVWTGVRGGQVIGRRVVGV
jgi:transposase-like protein